MRHVRPDDGARLAAALPRRRVVDGLEQAQLAGQAVGGETLQVEARRFGRNHQRQCRRVGRHDEVVAKPSLQTQPGNAERAVLVIQVDVDGVVAALRHSPRHPALPSVLDLPLDRAHDRSDRATYFHRSASPAAASGIRTSSRSTTSRTGSPPASGQQAPEREPAFLRQLSLRDGDEIAQSCFGGQQIVIARYRSGDRATLYPITSCRRTLSNRNVIVHRRKRRCACDASCSMAAILAVARSAPCVTVMQRSRARVRSRRQVRRESIGDDAVRARAIPE